ncbi:LacI family DNA-binding transcriptional regulator [Allostreptomyces psammosilenae]|uniref:DNA-binding LacI/PurR family transcriptional regulator n=1 Tax=Allostreptomyces psammosilenae TaxID=1892865 RepID=A0A852ZY04_9ACTN|nr:LacI family DNA-binding transcriptional regulator [Allostreptomyces psammosilenae]NYI03511.1 DNA-binding LacI/PurR family transcriptional regulator [Allostreptomyces psammosilenae]
MKASERGRPPVIADVAREAGVSVPTVSRVLNGTAPVSPEKRARVLTAVRTLGYRPNGAARALVRGKHSMIALFAGNTTRHGYAATIQGVEEAARQAGYTVVISVVESPDQVTVDSALDLILSHPVAGAVVLEYDPPGESTLRAMPASLPVVAAAASYSVDRSIPHTYMDDRTAAEHATRYLLDLGHETVHHLAIPRSTPWTGRTAGWRDALEKAGRAVPEVLEADWTARSGYRIGLELAARTDVTAVLCGNDEVAMGLMRALTERGRRIPEDVSVVGFDDHPLSELWSPSLTTVRQDFVELGWQTFGLLATAMGGGRPQSLSVSPELVVRSSSARAPRRSG